MTPERIAELREYLLERRHRTLEDAWSPLQEMFHAIEALQRDLAAMTELEAAAVDASSRYRAALKHLADEAVFEADRQFAREALEGK